jgi:methyltransferase (TIGR00027 family)
VEALGEVAMTAFGVAAARAAETARPDRLFCDSFAAGFVRRAGSLYGSREGGEPRRREALNMWITVRTRFLDELLAEACAGGARQVVILGAGLDARAFRLAWPEGLRLFELDMPAVLEFKQDVIRAEGWQPSCERIAVPADLSEDWSASLLESGLEAGAPVAWVAEGLLAYLSPATSDALVAGAAALSPPGSRFGLTLASARRLQAWRERHPGAVGATGDYIALWRSAKAEEAVGWLASHSWRARVFDVAERAASYGRAFERDVRARPETVASENRARLVDAVRL